MSNYLNLLGVPYLAGKHDCYSVCRTYLRETYGIALPNFARPNRFWEDPHLDLYAMYGQWGFVQVFDKPIELGDILLMPILTPVNSHAAIVVEGNQILHHLPGHLSCIDPLWPKWGSRANMILRHPLITKYHQDSRTTIHLHEVIDADILRDPRLQATIDELLASGH